MFFNSQDESYRVLCIDGMLEGGHLNQDSVVVLNTIKDCREYLEKNCEYQLLFNITHINVPTDFESVLHA